MRSFGTLAARWAAGAAVLIAVLLAAAVPAVAQDTGWQIDSFDVDLTVNADGSLRVVENIAVDFRDLERHGIFRVIPVRYDIAASDVQVDIPEGRRADEYQREILVENIAVQSTAPNDLQIDGPDIVGRVLTIRIGDEDSTISGRQSYRISYDVRGALNDFETHGELYWNATGTEWEVPILAATTTVTAPAVDRATCFRGTLGATSLCDDVQTTRDTATFRADDLQPGEGLTVVTAFPRDAVDVPPPIISEKWTVDRALTGAPGAVPATYAIAGLGFGAVGWLAYRQGRDRITRGNVSVDGKVEGEGRRRPLFAGRVTPVEFRPPDNLRPGQVGVLIDERVDPVDISATIVDLAVRGHLRITEVEDKKLWGSRTDWKLEQLEAPADELLPYEQRLLTGLFSGRTEVEIGDLKGTFADDYKAVKTGLYDDAVKRRWFAKRPDSVRNTWLFLGILLTVLGIGGFVIALLFSTWALAVLPVMFVGIALTVAHRWMPHRTVAGSRTLDKVLGFREFIVNAEAGRAEYAEQQNLFVTYLPYAVVFGAVDKWARTFAELAAASGTGVGVGAWYVGAHPGYFDANRFSSGLSDFSTNVGASLPTAAPSSSGGGGGGFSGGGFGGGGGGSW